jgi:hypothetical protein
MVTDARLRSAAGVAERWLERGASREETAVAYTEATIAAKELTGGGPHEARKAGGEPAAVWAMVEVVNAAASAEAAGDEQTAAGEAFRSVNLARDLALRAAAEGREGEAIGLQYNLIQESWPPPQ